MGRFLAKIPLHPRYGAMLYGETQNKDVLLAASILSEGGVLSAKAHFDPEEHEHCDLRIQVDLLKDEILKAKTKFSDYHHSFLSVKKAAQRKRALLEPLQKSRGRAANWTFPLLLRIPF